jgi:hypothetical protein
MKKLSYLLICGAGILTVSCEHEDSSDVNQDKIYTEYELFYNANEDKTHAVARFRFGSPTGTLLELTDSSGAFVMYNGDTLPYNVWYGGHHAEYAGNLTGGTFTYSNTEGTVFENDVPTGTTIAFPAGFDTIDKSVAQNLAWTGTALGADEHVGIFVGSWTWGEDAVFYTEDDGATQVVMGVTQMANLAIGSATVYMDRTHSTTVIEGTSEGGVIKYTYRGLNATVQVIE